VFKSRLSIDKLTILEECVSSPSSVKHNSSRVDLQLFINTSNLNFISGTNLNNSSYYMIKSYLVTSSNLLQDKYYNTNLSISKLGTKDIYTNSIKENISLANQTR
jgi:hypothetical protein